MSEEDQGYEVVDKRKVKLGEDGEVQAEPETEAPEAQAEAEAEPSGAEEPSPEERFELPPVDVYALLNSFIGILGAHAWQWMGLVKNPVTGQLDKDMTQAKIAIDTVSAIIAQLEGKAPPAEHQELRSLLSDLQINFVKQSGG
jgi:hypothetical protein